MLAYEAATELVDCDGCGHMVVDGTICENCGVPTDGWLEANPEEDCPLDGDHDSAMASIG
jgi:ribosomal protein L32